MAFVAQQLDDEAENDKRNSRTEKKKSNKKRKKRINSTAYIKKIKFFFLRCSLTIFNLTMLILALKYIKTITYFDSVGYYALKLS